MSDVITGFWTGLSPEARARLNVFLLSMLPIAELRGGIPVGLALKVLPWWDVFVTAIAGNMLPIVPFLCALGPLTRFLERWEPARRAIEAVFARTQRKGGLIEKYEAVGLMLFVAVPLPMTGAWSGAIAAHIFGIRRRYAIPAITLGVIIAGVVVTLVCKGGLAFFRAFV